MNTIELIKTMQDRETGEATVAVALAEVRQTKTQKDYLSLMLADKTGTIKGKVWDWNTSDPAVLPGTVWDIKFEYSPYQGSPGLVVRKFREVPTENVDDGLFIDSLTTEQFKYYNGELKSLVGQIKDDLLQRYIQKLLHTIHDIIIL